jgi:hypothetical protein
VEALRFEALVPFSAEEKFSQFFTFFYFHFTLLSFLSVFIVVSIAVRPDV